jgi:hypothetical protein
MNTLASLKSKLMVKPDINQREKIAVYINEPSLPKESVPVLEEGEVVEEKEENEKGKEIKLIDERDKGYNIEGLMKRLSKSNILLVKQKTEISQKLPEEVVKPNISEELPPSKKAKKVAVKKPLVIEEEDEEEGDKPKDVEDLDLELEKADQLTVKLPANNIHEAWQRLLKIYNMKGSFVDLSVIDLRIENKVYLQYGNNKLKEIQNFKL